MPYRAGVLADIMRARGLSNAALAALADVDRSTVFRIRTGRVVPSLPVARRIADALHVDVARFISREGE